MFLCLLCLSLKKFAEIPLWLNIYLRNWETFGWEKGCFEISYRLARTSFFLFCVFMVFLCCPYVGSAEHFCTEEPLVTARAAVLLDANSGQVLFEKNAGQRMPPASTTKIMTALLALEGGNLQSPVTVSPWAAAVGEASLDLRAGEKLTLEELIFGALLESGNDACVAIAEHIAGTEKHFVTLMNQKALMLGAMDTSFKNTNGLPAPGHYTTARDLAVITRHALGNPLFKEIVSTRQKTIGGNRERHLNNTNRLLWSYSWADGVKTGTTNEAGQCLVASGTIDGRQVISVVLNSENRWRDSTLLLNHGHEHFENQQVFSANETFATIPVKEGDVQEIKALVPEEYTVVIPKGRSDLIDLRYNTREVLYAPVIRGDFVGNVVVSVNGKYAGSVDLVSDRQVTRKNTLQLFLEKIFKQGATGYDR